MTDYGFAGGAFGSRARAATAGIASGHTAFSYFGCTRKAGVHRENHLAEAGNDGVLIVEGVSNDTESYENRRRVGSRATSRVAKAVLGDPAGLHIAVDGLRTSTNVFASRRSGKLGARSSFTSAAMTGHTGNEQLDDVLDGLGGTLGDLLDEVADQIDQQGGGALVLPGLGEIGLGVKRNRLRATSATAHASALNVRLYAANGVKDEDDVNVVLGKSRSVIVKNLPAGVMRGRAVPVQGNLADGLVSLGRVADVPLPCQGTRGKVKRDATANVDLLDAGQLEVDALEGRTYGVQHDRGSARAWTRATVAGLRLGGGELVIKGIVGRAHVQTNRTGGIIGKRTNTWGSTIGELRVAGEVRALPAPGDVIELPSGLATVEFFDTERGTRGISTTAVRVTLLQGTAAGSIIELGKAQAYIKRS